ncbi:MAG: PAS domain S-box protein [Smithellaceae bacterium]
MPLSAVCREKLSPDVRPVLFCRDIFKLSAVCAAPYMSLLLFFLFFNPVVHAGYIEDRQNGAKIVLILNSYHPGYVWSDDEQQGALEILSRSRFVDTLAVEYQDSKNFTDPVYLDRYRSLLQHKYRGKRLSLVLVMDNDALEFVLNNRRELFGHVPVVFCGINDYNPETLHGHSNITGIAQNVDPEGTLDLMLALHPDTREILVINDYTLTGLSFRREVEALEPKYQGRVLIRYNDNVTFDELCLQVGRLSEGRLVLLQSYAVDKSGTVFGWQEVTRQLTRDSRVPVYGVHAERLGLGIVGGKLLTGRKHGRDAALLAERVLSGEKADNIPVVTESAAQAMFDHQAMRRFGVDDATLPRHSVVINRPVSFFKTHQNVIIVASVVIVYLLIVIGFLSVYIAQRRRAATALSASEERFRSIIENTDAGYFFTELSGRMTGVNRAWLKLYGYEHADEVIGRSFMDLQKDDDIEQARVLIRGILHDDPRYYTGVFSRKMKNGDIGYHTYSARAVRKGGKVIGIEGFIIDTTALSRAEKALRESERKFRSLFDAMTEGVALHELLYDENHLPCDYRIIDVNPAYEKHTGISADRAKGQISKVVHPEGEVPFLDEYARVALTGEPYSFEPFFEPLNKYFSISVFSPARGQFATLFQDISGRKKMEAALAAETERLLVTLRSIGDGVITTDVEGRIRLMNEVAETLTGWKNDEAEGLPLTDVFQIIHEETRQRCENPVQKVLESGHIVGLANHTALIAKDGKEIIIADSAAPIRGRDNRTIGVVLVFRDTTDTKKMEEALRNAQKIEAIGILAGGIAHDFNNLLSGIYGYLEMIKTQIDHGGDLAQITASVSRAFTTYDRAKNLTLQLLTFAKGGTPIRRVQPIDQLIREVVGFVLAGSGIAPVFKIPAGEWICNCDESQIAQVIDNIVINARQAMPQGGTLEVSLSCVGSQDVPADMEPVDCIMIAIRDTGPGIDRKHLPHIFDPFFTTRQQGSGLGLATSYSIIKRHGGLIEAQSEPGAGTVFRVYLPQAERSRESLVVKEMAKPEPRKSGGTVLVMDDEDFILDVASAMVKTMGYAVATAKNGDEAIQMMRDAVNQKQPFVAAILDLTIPGGKGGKETAGPLREVYPGLKIIASSGYSDDPVMAHPEDFGFDDRLVKPYRLDDLHTVLKAILS